MTGLKPKKLPGKLVKRLRAASEKISPRLQKMKNIDYRRHKERERGTIPGFDKTLFAGFRIREMNVSRNFPHSKLVLKRIDVTGITAKKYIGKIRDKVEKHNEKFQREDYKIVMIDLQAISPDIIAMPKVDAVSLFEIVEGFSEKGKRTAEELAEKGFDLNRLADLRKRAVKNSDFRSRNLFFLGLEKGKPVFSPLGDLD